MTHPPAAGSAAGVWLARLETAAARIDRAFVIIAELSLLALLLLLAVSIAGRTFLNASIPDRSLIAQNYLMVALVFFALGHVQKIGVHIEVTVLANLVSARINKAFRTIGLALGLAIFGGATWFSGVRAWQAYSVDELMFSSVLDLRDWPGLAVVSVPDASTAVSAHVKPPPPRPPPPPPKSKRVLFTIESQPRGATVSHNGEVLCEKTPCKRTFTRSKKSIKLVFALASHKKTTKVYRANRDRKVVVRLPYDDKIGTDIKDTVRVQDLK